MKHVSRTLVGISSIIFGFLYIPILIVIVYSFNATRYGVMWSGFTTEWYLSLLQNELALAATKNTLILAGGSTLISTTLGSMLGCSLARYRVPGQKWFNQLLYLPVYIPDVVIAASLVLFYSLCRQWFGLFPLGLSTMICAHVTVQIPFVAIVVRARMAGLDPGLLEAAHDLGANRWQTFWRITFPLLLPGVMAGGLLAFTLSLDDFVISYFTSGPGASTVPILIYSSVKRGITPEINALSSIIVAVSVFAIGTVTLIQRGRLR